MFAVIVALVLLGDGFLTIKIHVAPDVPVEQFRCPYGDYSTCYEDDGEDE